MFDFKVIGILDLSEMGIEFDHLVFVLCILLLDEFAAYLVVGWKNFLGNGNVHKYFYNMHRSIASIELLSISFEIIVIVVSQIVVIVCSTATVHASSIQTTLPFVVIFIILYCVNVIELFVVQVTYS